MIAFGGGAGRRRLGDRTPTPVRCGCCTPARRFPGIGAGAIYATCVGNAVKWFPDRRGLAVGLTAAGFGAGAALTVIPIRMMIDALGYRQRLLLVRPRPGPDPVVVAPLLRAPDAGRTCRDRTAARCRRSAASSRQREMLRSPVFWLLYVMFVLVSASGLMATAQTRADRQGFRPVHAAVCSWAAAR